ncbi:MAG: hypothetical protein OJF51_002466 [Nitrospira sp.]|nr:MAG: hypothetical protein OJF51_002466 [Nitrospira sp.]
MWRCGQPLTFKRTGLDGDGHIAIQRRESRTSLHTIGPQQRSCLAASSFLSD